MSTKAVYFPIFFEKLEKINNTQMTKAKNPLKKIVEFKLMAFVLQANFLFF